jgi:hypothetical protein
MTRNWRAQASTNRWQRLPDPHSPGSVSFTGLGKPVRFAPPRTGRATLCARRLPRRGDAVAVCWPHGGRGGEEEANTVQGLQGDLPQALLRLFETLTGSHAMQGSQGVLVVIIAVAAFFAGLCGERLRAKLARQAWQKRRWRRGQRVPFKARWRRGEGVVPPKTEAVPVSDPAEQLRLVMGAEFNKRRLLSRSEAQVLYAAERAINTAADLNWRVMAQVSLGEVLACPDARAYSAINSKRVDLLVVSRRGDPIAAIEYQGHGHYQGTAAAC